MPRATATPPRPVAPGPVHLTHQQILVVFSGLVLAMLLAALDSTIVATALPTIVGELGGLERLGWVVTAYLLAQTVVTPLYGKLGDQHGRKIVLQSAIVIFLIGSVLCGMAADMTQLIAFRAIQGLGGGGIMVTTQAVVGDIVPPRDRGRYQGIFGAVFGISSIAGPLLGGYFTTELSWRWIFYINIPFGILALVVIASTLPLRSERVRHSIDVAGITLLATALSAIVLFADLGGIAYAWTSPVMIALAVTSVVALAGFVFAERRAREPVLPLGLFRNRTFVLTAAIGGIVGVALFGSVTYLPLFLQVVNGASPTGSGLQMLPLMGGMLITSIGSGQLISRWGRYRIFPIVGTALMSAGLLMLSRMDAATTIAEASLNMLVLGLGMGCIMQVLIIAVQNAVDHSQLGVATSGATLFRLIGGSLGTAVFGAIFASGLTTRVQRAFAGTAGGLPESANISPESLARLAPAVRAVYVDAFTTSMSTVFLVAMAIAIVAFALSWLVPEIPLRGSFAALAADVAHDAESVFPMPSGAGVEESKSDTRG
jgi:EmrB/QacA subfamily drug resistance transporter